MLTLLELFEYANKAGSFDNLAMARRSVELAASCAALDQWESGAPYLKQILSYWEQ